MTEYPKVAAKHTAIKANNKLTITETETTIQRKENIKEHLSRDRHVQNIRFLLSPLVSYIYTFDQRYNNNNNLFMRHLLDVQWSKS